MCASNAPQFINCKSLPFFYFLTFEKAYALYSLSWSVSPIIFLLQMIPPFTNLFFSPPWTKYFPSPNIFLLFILHLLVIVNVNVKDLNRTNKNQNSNKRHCLLGLVLAFFAPSLPLGIYMCSNTKYHHWHTSMSIFNRSTSELRVQPATFSLLTHLVTTWNQEMLAHLKIC